MSADHNAGHRWRDVDQSGPFVWQGNELGDSRLVRRIRPANPDAMQCDEIIAGPDEFADLLRVMIE